MTTAERSGGVRRSRDGAAPAWQQATGAGPLMSMVRHAAQRGRQDPVVLVGSATTSSHAFHRDELAGPATRHCWLRVVHCTTRDPDEPRAHDHRRTDQAVPSESPDAIDPHAAYRCGPPAMVEATADALGGLGVAPEALWTEKYD